MSTLRDLLSAANHVALVYLCAVLAGYVGITALSWAAVRRFHRRVVHGRLRRSLRSRLTPPISVCVPCFNEAEVIVDSIHSLLSLQYPEHDVVVVNDGSTDTTLERMIDTFELHRVDQPRCDRLPTAHVRGIWRSRVHSKLVVVDKENGGRADANNAAINVAHYPLVCIVDADSMLERGALLSAVRPFLDDPQRTVAAGGIVRVANGCEAQRGHVVDVALPRRPLPMFQTVEYLRAFTAARTGWSTLNGLIIISGALGLFRKDVPDPVCWTESPEKLRELGGQRDRWHRGLTDTLWRPRRMIANPRYGVVGMLTLPFFALFEFCGAFIEIGGYGSVALSLSVGAINVSFAVLFYALATLSGIFLSLSALLLEDVSFRTYARGRDYARLIAYSVGENFGYRQLMTLYRVRGFFNYLRRDDSWGEIERMGFAEEPLHPDVGLR